MDGWWNVDYCDFSRLSYLKVTRRGDVNVKTHIQQAATHVLTCSECVNGKRGIIREAAVVLIVVTSAIRRRSLRRRKELNFSY
jgi:hypothetical protein